MVLFRGYSGTGAATKTHLTHSISILHIHILDYPRHLALQLQLLSFSKVQSRCVNNGKQDPVESGFTNLHTRRANALCGFACPLEETVNDSFLVGRRGRRDVRRFEQKAQEGRLACAFGANNLYGNSATVNWKQGNEACHEIKRGRDPWPTLAIARMACGNALRVKSGGLSGVHVEC